jgi:hypothetical protein
LGDGHHVATSCALVCRRWAALTSDAALWKALALRLRAADSKLDPSVRTHRTRTHTHTQHTHARSARMSCCGLIGRGWALAWLHRGQRWRRWAVGGRRPTLRWPGARGRPRWRCWVSRGAARAPCSICCARSVLSRTMRPRTARFVQRPRKPSPGIHTEPPPVTLQLQGAHSVRLREFTHVLSNYLSLSAAAQARRGQGRT